MHRAQLLKRFARQLADRRPGVLCNGCAADMGCGSSHSCVAGVVDVADQGTRLIRTEHDDQAGGVRPTFLVTSVNQNLFARPEEAALEASRLVQADSSTLAAYMRG